MVGENPVPDCIATILQCQQKTPIYCMDLQFREWFDAESILSKLESEEVVDILDKNAKDNEIKEAFQKIFMRPISSEQISYIKNRLKSQRKNPYAKPQFENQTTEVADAYRQKHGKNFDKDKANAIAEELFLRKLNYRESQRIKKLIKEEPPKRLTPLYKVIATEIKKIMANNKKLSLTQAYNDFVLRPPYDFERKYLRGNKN